MKIALNKTSSFRNIITLSNNEVKIVTKIQYGVDIGDTSTETRYIYTRVRWVVEFLTRVYNNHIMGRLP